jgi:hypothetical protein
MRQPAKAPPQSESVRDHPRAVLDRAHAAGLDVPPLDGELSYDHPVDLGPQQHLHVEREPARDQVPEQVQGGVTGEGLQPTLRVWQPREAEGPQQHVEQLPGQLAEGRLRHDDVAQRCASSGGHHVAAAHLQQVEAALDLRYARRQVGIGEGDEAAAGLQHARLDGRPLSLVAVQPQDAGFEAEPADSRFNDGGRAVVTAVVDEDELGTCLPQRRRGERGDGGLHPGGLPVHRDDERSVCRTGCQGISYLLIGDWFSS